MKFRTWTCLLAFALLGGCATGYQSNTSLNALFGPSGGYWDSKGPGSLLKVGFTGNVHTSRESVGSYLLYRCAEVAKREGGTHFLLYPNLPAAIADIPSTERSVSTVQNMPSTYAYILIVPAGTDKALSVEDLMTRLAPLVKPTQQGKEATP